MVGNTGIFFSFFLHWESDRWLPSLMISRFSKFQISPPSSILQQILPTGTTHMLWASYAAIQSMNINFNKLEIASSCNICMNMHDIFSVFIDILGNYFETLFKYLFVLINFIINYKKNYNKNSIPNRFFGIIFFCFWDTFSLYLKNHYLIISLNNDFSGDLKHTAIFESLIFFMSDI